MGCFMDTPNPVRGTLPLLCYALFDPSLSLGKSK